MQKKKGFVFIETIVVMAVLLSSLLILYATFTSLAISEKRRLMYDDVAYLYRTYYVKKYFSSQRIDRILENLDPTDSSNNANFLISFGCGSRDVFTDYVKEGAFCEIMSQNLHISNLYLTYYDLSALQNCSNHTTGLCTTYAKVNQELADYLRTLGGKGISGYRMIVEYQENEKGNYCTTEEKCKHHFATIRIGD